MDDLTQYLYEFLMERCMRDLREDAEYNEIGRAHV